MNQIKEKCNKKNCSCYSCIYNCEACYNADYIKFNTLTAAPDKCLFLSKTNLMCKNRKIISNMKEGNNNGSK